MDILKILTQFLFGSTGLMATFLFCLAGADAIFRKESAEHASQILKLNFTTSSSTLRVVDHYFSADLPALRFLRNVIGLTLIGLAGAVLQYVIYVDGFWTSLRTDSYARAAFLRQVATTGLPMVLAANLVAATVYVWLRRGFGARATGLPVMVFDFFMRLGAFVAVMFVTYRLSAQWLGSFQGNVDTAMSAVGPTLQSALQFENLTSAYLLAVMLGAVPIFVAGSLDLMSRFPKLAAPVMWVAGHVEFRAKPIRTIGVVLALFISVFVLVARLWATALFG